MFQTTNQIQPVLQNYSQWDFIFSVDFEKITFRMMPWRHIFANLAFFRGADSPRAPNFMHSNHFDGLSSEKKT